MPQTIWQRPQARLEA